MSIDDTVPGGRRGILRVRVGNPEFRQQIRNADIIVAADIRNPRNSWVVFHDARLQDYDWQDVRTAELLTVPVDCGTDDAKVLGELCRMLKGPLPRSMIQGASPACETQNRSLCRGRCCEE
jgi:hypothetical protein